MTPIYLSSLGCAGFTVNDKNQLLVIQEKRGPAAFGQHWKLPGGHADKSTYQGISNQ
ncbi:hypothetical protein DPMN_018301 [Dreissena polymorpha]|uniref:Nudix hydrolase domain-containing protein n=1 Tax=Dreissena polymorpha TaxID=45954 RepID=A0A9D4NGE6_DREPO|nr:hypothetical protein DPMN_018301 [Dreissena polymorpha]